MGGSMVFCRYVELYHVGILQHPTELAPQIYGIIKYRDLYLYSDIDLWWNEYSIAYFYLYTAKV